MSECDVSPDSSFVQYQERVDRAFRFIGHQRVTDLVLDITRRDAVHTLALGLFAQLFDALFR